jgi:hypothetical protein
MYQFGMNCGETSMASQPITITLKYTTKRNKQETYDLIVLLLMDI